MVCWKRTYAFFHEQRIQFYFNTDVYKKITHDENVSLFFLYNYDTFSSIRCAFTMYSTYIHIAYFIVKS